MLVLILFRLPFLWPLCRHLNLKFKGFFKRWGMGERRFFVVVGFIFNRQLEFSPLGSECYPSIYSKLVLLMASGWASRH